MTKNDQLLRIKNEYRAAHNNQPASARMMSDWAVAQGKYELPRFAAERKCAEELADAMRLEHMTAKGNRRVRVMHSWKTEQGTLWDNIKTISIPNMALSMASKRNGIVGEVKQIKRDLDFFNDLHPDEKPLQVSFNFENDLADAGLSDPFSTVLGPPVGPPPGAPLRKASWREPSPPSSHPSGRA